MQDLQLIGIHTRGHRMRLLRDIRKIPRLDIEEDIPVSFLMTYMVQKGIIRDRIRTYSYSLDIKPKAQGAQICELIWLCLKRTGNYQIYEFDWLKTILTSV